MLNGEKPRKVFPRFKSALAKSIAIPLLDWSHHLKMDFEPLPAFRGRGDGTRQIWQESSTGLEFMM
jgi:hypothetical protein